MLSLWQLWTAADPGGVIPSRRKVTLTTTKPPCDENKQNIARGANKLGLADICSAAATKELEALQVIASECGTFFSIDSDS